ncbi:MAG: GNAT family N-acetyltransferase [Rhizobiales bacterium]|nr:GNAT family N-acetyltransferase [Hyphomicrobiales bacterium]
MARANPTIGMRPFLAADTPLLAEVFRQSIEDLTAEDYSPAQQEAWMARADDEDAFGERLAGGLTLVGMFEGSPVGFVSLRGSDTIDMLYVHPAATGHGVASMLVDAIEKLAAARGAAKLTTDASDTARRFFEKRGYVPQRRNTVPVDDEWLGNTTMAKSLVAQESAKETS